MKNLKLNNRMFAFQLTLKKELGSGMEVGKEVLFLYGLGDIRTVHGVKKLEVQTGLKAVALLNNGGIHHIYLKYWYDHFPNLHIWICPTRAHHTMNQQQLRQKYSKRWELADNTTTKHHIHQLLEYFDDNVIDCVLFNQLFVHGDTKAGWMGCTDGCDDTNDDDDTTTNIDKEEKLTPKMYTNSEFVPLLMDMSTQDSATDEPILFYKPLKLIITGHHWEVRCCIY